MLHNIIMPKLGESVTEGTIVKWLVKPGDIIKQYDNLLEVETAKVVAEVPATEGGIVKELLFKEGDTVKVGTVICTIEVSEESVNLNNLPTPQDNFTGNNNKQTVNIEEIKKPSPLNSNSNKVRYSPAVLTLAQEHNIDLTQISGSGLEGRVTRKDVLSFMDGDNKTNKGNSNPLCGESNKNENIQVSVNKEQIKKLENGDEHLAISPVRKVIAKKMVESVSKIPHAWLTVEVDATNLVKVRNSIKNEFLSKEKFPITYFSFFIVEIVKALRNFPLLNSEWKEDYILLKKDINISIAVAVGNSLFVPVIKNADTKNVNGIAKEIFDLATKAKNNKLTPEDMEGGSFTINNTGSFGSVSSMGIINYPQAAILQIESIIKRPVVLQENTISIRDMVNLSLSIDHRIVDGYIAGSFLKEVKYNIENINK